MTIYIVAESAFLNLTDVESVDFGELTVLPLLPFPKKTGILGKEIPCMRN
ncbi:MAG TPA: hypothetical protein VN278_04960 [Methanosarcina sp.]|nr:hypothetical protein [Methanosarcina sp.]